MNKWDQLGMDIAMRAGDMSKDPSTKVGACVVSADRRMYSLGWNGFPSGMSDDERLNNREEKYPRIIHAEVNAILNARCDVTGWTCMCTMHPCQHCASVLIQCGIARLVCPPPQGRWAEEQLAARLDMQKCGIVV